MVTKKQAFLSEEVVYGGELVPRGQMISDLQEKAKNIYPDDIQAQVRLVNSYLPGHARTHEIEVCDGDKNHENRIFKIDYIGGGYSEKEWFDLSLEAFADDSPSLELRDYDYIQIIPLKSYRKYFFSNDGTQAFRHKKTGWTIPDYCRQRGGCPEIWTKSRRRNLVISEDSPVWEFIVCDGRAIFEELGLEYVPPEDREK